MAASPTPRFSKLLERFRDKLPDGQKEEFSMTQIEDVERAVEEVQARLGPEKRLRNFPRIRKFLEGMQQVEQLVKVFLNVSEVVAFVWGPIKFAIMVAASRIDAIELLIDACIDVGDTLHGLNRYERLFTNHPEGTQILENYFEDILNFHQCVLEVFARSAWKRYFVDSAWPTFRARFRPILDSLKRHKALLSNEKINVLLEEVQDMRSVADVRLANLSETLRDGLGEIKQALQEKQAAAHDYLLNQRTAMKFRLCAPDYKADHEAVRSQRLLSSSGDWVISDEAFVGWLQRTGSSATRRVLYLSGGPGCGKTTLVSRVIDHMKSQPQTLGGPLVYFYFRHQEAPRNTAGAMFRAIISQLADQETSILEHLLRKWTSLEDPKELFDVSVLRQWMKDCLGNLSRVWLVLDGVDACAAGPSEALELFRDVIDDPLSGAASSGVDIRLLVAGQRDGIIDQILRSHPEIRLDRVEGHLRDIEQYARLRASQLRDRFSLGIADETGVIQRVTDGSRGMFLYAKVVLNNLFEQDSIAEFKKEMLTSNFPKGLDEAYERIALRLIDGQSYPRRRSVTSILGWVLCAARPLYWREIQSLFCIDLEKETCDFDNRRIDGCKKICGALIETETCEYFADHASEELVHLVHETAGRYLLHSQRIDIYEKQLALAIFCSRYLRSNPVRESSSRRDIESSAQSGYYGVLDYAVAHWRRHTNIAISIPITKISSNDTVEVVRSALQLLGAWRGSSRGADTRAIPSSSSQGGGVPTTEEVGSIKDQWNNQRDERIPELEARVTSIRETIEHLMSSTTLPAESIQSFVYLCGQPRFKCPKIYCDSFACGFKDREKRDSHVLEHERPFKCAEEGCFARITGFPSQGPLGEHRKRFHPTEDSVSFAFPGVKQTKEPPILAACARGDLEEVKRLHIAGANLQHQVGKIHRTPLLVAVRGGHDLICKYLLDHGASPDDKEVQFSPLCETIRLGNTQLFQLLFSTMDERTQATFFARGVSAAILANSLPFLEVLMEGTPLERIQESATEVLGEACGRKFGKFRVDNMPDTDIVHTWFRRGFATSYAPNSLEILPDAIQKAQRSGLPDDFCGSAGEGLRGMLHQAIIHERHSLIHFILDIMGPLSDEVITGRKEGATALHTLALWVNATSHRADCSSCTEICQLLVSADNSASANLALPSGSLPLHGFFALTLKGSGNLSIFKILVGHSSNLNSRNKKGEAPIERAIYRRGIDHVRILLETGGIDLGGRNKEGRTAFSAAMKPVRFEREVPIQILSLLGDAYPPGLWLPDESDEPMTPLHHALDRKLTEPIKFLLGHPQRDQILEQFHKSGSRVSKHGQLEAQLRKFAADEGLTDIITMLDRR